MLVKNLSLIIRDSSWLVNRFLLKLRTSSYKLNDWIMSIWNLLRLCITHLTNQKLLISPRCWSYSNYKKMINSKIHWKITAQMTKWQCLKINDTRYSCCDWTRSWIRVLKSYTDYAKIIFEAGKKWWTASRKGVSESAEGSRRYDMNLCDICF